MVGESHRKLSKPEVSLLSKGLKFCPTLNSIEKLILKEDFKKFGKKVQSGTVTMIIEYLTLILLNLSLILIQPKLMLR